MITTILVIVALAFAAYKIITGIQTIKGAIDEIATLPAAPPSKLSKKLIALQIPTTQNIVNSESKNFDPVGFPTVSVTTKSTAVKMPARLCAINLGRGFKFFISSQSPISPSAKAGAKTDVASQKVLAVKFENNEAEAEIDITPIIMATPPK